MLLPIEQLNNRHQGEDIYLLASGASMDYYPKYFFQDRLLVGVNRIPHFFKCAYTVIHHQELIPELLPLDTTLIVSTFQRCIIAEGAFHIDLLQADSCTHYQYETLEQGFSNIDYSAYELNNYLLTGGSTIVSALHFCHFIGAKTVFVCGMDGRDVDGKMNFSGYHTQIEHQAYQKLYVDGTKELLLETCNFLRGKGTTILGINPFIDLNLRADLFIPPEVIK